MDCISVQWNSLLVIRVLKNIQGKKQSGTKVTRKETVWYQGDSQRNSLVPRWLPKKQSGTKVTPKESLVPRWLTKKQSGTKVTRKETVWYQGTRKETVWYQGDSQRNSLVPRWLAKKQSGTKLTPKETVWYQGDSQRNSLVPKWLAKKQSGTKVTRKETVDKRFFNVLGRLQSHCCQDYCMLLDWERLKISLVSTESLSGTKITKYHLVTSSGGKMKVNTESSYILFKPFNFMFLPN